MFSSNESKAQEYFEKYKTLINNLHIRGTVDPATVFRQLFAEYSKGGYDWLVYNSRNHAKFLKNSNPEISYLQLLLHLNDYAHKNSLEAQGDFYALWTAMFYFYGRPPTEYRHLESIANHAELLLAKAGSAMLSKEKYLLEDELDLTKPLNSVPKKTPSNPSCYSPEQTFPDLLQDTIGHQPALWKLACNLTVPYQLENKLIDTINQQLNNYLFYSCLPSAFKILLRISGTEDLRFDLEAKMIAGIANDTVSPAEMHELYADPSKIGVACRPAYLNASKLKCQSLLNQAPLENYSALLYYSQLHPELRIAAHTAVLATIYKSAQNSAHQFGLFLDDLIALVSVSESFQQGLIDTLLRILRNSICNNTYNAIYVFLKNAAFSPESRHYLIQQIISDPFVDAQHNIKILNTVDISDYPAGDIINYILPHLSNPNALLILDTMPILPPEYQLPLINYFIHDFLNSATSSNITVLNTLFTKLTPANQLYFFAVLEQRLDSIEASDVSETIIPLVKKICVALKRNFFRHPPQYDYCLEKICNDSTADIEAGNLFYSFTLTNVDSLKNFDLCLQKYPASYRPRLIQRAVLTAITYGQTEFLKKLFEAYHNQVAFNEIFLDKKNKKTTLLREACLRGNEEIVQLLVKYKADCRIGNVLEIVMKGENVVGSASLIDLFLSKNAPIGDTFHQACGTLKSPLIEPFLIRGIDINRLNSQDETALFVTCRSSVHQLRSVVELLLKNGAWDNAACLYAIETENSRLLEKLLQYFPLKNKIASLNNLLAAASACWNEGKTSQNLVLCAQFIVDAGASTATIPVDMLLRTDALAKAFNTQWKLAGAPCDEKRQQELNASSLFTQPISPENIDRTMNILKCFPGGVRYRCYNNMTLLHTMCSSPYSKDSYGSKTKQWQDFMNCVIKLLQQGASLLLMDRHGFTPHDYLTHALENSTTPNVDYNFFTKDWSQKTSLYLQQELFTRYIMLLALGYTTRNPNQANDHFLFALPFDIVKYVIAFAVTGFTPSLTSGTELIQNPTFVTKHVMGIFASTAKVINARQTQPSAQLAHRLAP